MPRSPRILNAALLALLSGAGLEAREIPIFVSGKDRLYSTLSTEDPQLVTVRGPGELRLVSRARFAPGTEGPLRYSLLVRLDGGTEQEVAYERVEPSRTAVFRDSNLGVPGRLMDHRIRLSQGYHNVELRAARGSPQVFLRYLFEPSRPPRRSWVPLAPFGDPEPVDLIVRETIVTYYRNAPGEAFDLRVIGPTELRIFTRFENTAEARGRVHYRLQVSRDGKVVNTFQLGRRRSEVAIYRHEDALVPGRAAEVIVPVPEGMHRFQITPLDPDKSTLLARFMLPREDLSLTAE